MESLNNIKINFDTLDAFRAIDKKINTIKNKINEDYKKAKKIIEENEYEEEINDYLNEKLLYLTNISKEYNNEINESYYSLREYLKQSIEDINNKINDCASITYKVFNQEFEKIASQTKPFNNSISEIENNIEELQNITTLEKSEHKINSINSSITNMRKEGEFIFDIQYKQDNIKKLIIMAKIINRSRPNKANFDINSGEEGCNKVVNNFDIEFQGANYTMDIIFDSETNKINISTYTLFDEYQYYTETYKYNGSANSQTIKSGGITMNVQGKCNKRKIVLKEKEAKNVNEIKEFYSYIFNA